MTKEKRFVDSCKSYKLNDEEISQINEYFKKHWGKKISCVWHRCYAAHTGQYVVDYFPDLLWVPHFEHYMNANRDYAIVYEDKNVLPILASYVKVKTPRTYLSSTDGLLRDGSFAPLSVDSAKAKLHNVGEVFCKPSVRACSGRGCFSANFRNGIDTKTGRTISEVIKDLGENFQIQECIRCHDSIAAIYPTSVNTFRIITYRWKNEFYHMPVAMRIGQGGSEVDNACAGGMVVGVNDDGTLRPVATTEFNKQFSSHPDTGYVFADGKIEHFYKVVASAKKMHALLPQIGVFHWDFTIDEEGEPVLIEANVLNGNIWLINNAHGKSPFGEKTVEVIEWTRKMRDTNVRERKKYMFGKV